MVISTMCLCPVKSFKKNIILVLLSWPGEDEQPGEDFISSGETAGHQEPLPLPQVWGGLYRPTTKTHEEEGKGKWVQTLFSPDYPLDFPNS